MTLIAFMLHPWAQGVVLLDAEPRALADDLLVSAAGEHHAERFAAAYCFTFSYLHALGAKVSASKCYTFNTCPGTREQLARKFWVAIGACVQVVTSMRDLGGHMNLGLVLCGSTLNARLLRAITMARALAAKPWGLHDKLKLVKGLILPLA